MNMVRTIHRIVLGGLMLTATSIPVHAAAAEEPVNGPAPAPQQQEASKWDVAGHGVKQASGAVMEASKETAGTAWDSLKTESVEVWERTKTGSRELYDTVGEKSKEAWHATKEESKTFWEKGKASIHEATAPESPAAPTAPAAPSTAAPSVSPEAEPQPAQSSGQQQ